MGDNTTIRINADTSKLVTDLAVGKAAYKDFGKELRAVSAEIARGDESKEARAKAIELAAAYEAAGAKVSVLEGDLKKLRAEQARAAAGTGEMVQAQTQASGTARVLAIQLSQVGQQAMAGGNVLQALAIQLPDIAVGMSMAGKEAGGFAKVLASPLGIGVTVVASALIPLIGNLLDTGESADDATPKTYDFSKGLDVLTLSARESADAMAQLAEEMRGAIAVQGDFLDQKGRIASQSVIDIQTRITQLRADLEEEKSKVGNDYNIFSVDNATRGFRITNMQAELAKLQDSLANAQKAATAYAEALGERGVLESLDPAEKARGEYNRGVGRLRNNFEFSREDSVGAAAAGVFITQAQFEAEFKRLTEIRDKALEAAREAGRLKTGGSGADASAQDSIGDMTALIKQLFPGATITSTTGGKHVKGSDHYAGRAIDFVPGGGMNQYTSEQVQKMLEDAGVNIRRNASGTKQFFGPGRSANKPGDHDDHFHLAWSGEASPEAAARIAEREAAEQKRLAEAKAREARSLATGTADTDLSLKRIDVGDRRAQAQADFGDAMDSAHAIKDPQASEDAAIAAIERKKEAMRAFAQEEADAEIAAQEAKKTAYAGDVVAVQNAANQEIVIRANLTAQLNDIERQHTADLQREQDRRTQAAARAAQKELADKQRVISEIEGYEDQLVSGIIRGRQSLGQIVGSIALQMAERSIAADLHYFTRKRLLTAQELTMEQAQSRGGLLAHLLGETRKTAATVAGTQARATAQAVGAAQSGAIAAAEVVPHVVAEAAKTGATVVGNEARVAATAAGTAQSAAIVGAHNLKEITSHAATAAAAAYHALAGIPVVGPVLGAAAAAATFTAVTAFGALASFDKGANTIPNDMIAQIHAGERIVPAADNREMMAIMRAGSAGGGAPGDSNGSAGRGGDSYHLHYNPTVHGQLPFRDQLARHERHLFEMIQRGMRSGALRAA